MADERNAMMTREDRRPATGLLLDGRYRLAARIGSGGTGDVYIARDLRLGRQVAVKLIPEAPVAGSRRFEGEARMLAGFVHPNLVRVLDAGEHEGQWFLVMELIEGESLASRLVRGPLSSEETARLGASLASALAYVHDRGVVHRDVKPANILLGNEGWVWLADFGIARLVDGVGTTAAGTVPGTLAYLAPEQAEGQLVEPAADIYALGLVLLECLTGERAYAGTSSEITAARSTRGPAVPNDLDSGWASVIRTMTARAPGNRPSAPAVAGFLATMRTSGGRAPGARDGVATTATTTAVGAATAAVPAVGLEQGSAGPPTVGNRARPKPIAGTAPPRRLASVPARSAVRPAGSTRAPDITPMEGYPVVRHRPRRRPLRQSAQGWRRRGEGAVAGSVGAARRHPVRLFGALVVALVLLTGFLLGQGNGALPAAAQPAPSGAAAHPPDLATVVVRDLNTGLRDGEVSQRAAQAILQGMIASGHALPTAGSTLALVSWVAVLKTEIVAGQVRGSAAAALVSVVEKVAGFFGLRVGLPLASVTPKAAAPQPPRVQRVVTPTTAPPPAAHPTPTQAPPPPQAPPPKPPHHHRHHGGGGDRGDG